MRGNRVLTNPEGIKPVAKLNSRSGIGVVLFEDSTIAEERSTTDESIDDSPYHFFYRNALEINNPQLTEVRKISGRTMKNYNIVNYAISLSILSVFIYFFATKTDFSHYFPQAGLWTYGLIIAIIFSPELMLIYWKNSSRQQMTILKHSRDTPWLQPEHRLALNLRDSK